jgi:hypothetical protein
MCTHQYDYKRLFELYVRTTLNEILLSFVVVAQTEAIRARFDAVNLECV